jgi:hypothetical protein
MMLETVELIVLLLLDVPLVPDNDGVAKADFWYAILYNDGGRLGNIIQDAGKIWHRWRQACTALREPIVTYKLYAAQNMGRLDVSLDINEL